MDTTSEYISRINRVFDYIENNLDNNFTLNELAKVSLFSKYHFHRIFNAITGETPFQFIQRIRIERSAALLINKKNESITEIAYRCGFTDISIFSRNFKKRFNKSPKEWRNDKNSNLNQVQSNIEQEKNKISTYFCKSSKQIKWRTNMKLNKNVEIKELQDITVAYVRHIGAYQGNSQLFEGLWNKLFAWAGPRGLLNQKNIKSIALYHDDPNITEGSKLRTSICITVPDEQKVDGDIGKMKIEGGNYVVARFELTENDFTDAWNWVFGNWFPQSGYQPDDRPCFEMYPEEPKDGNFIVDICVPVKPL